MGGSDMITHMKRCVNKVKGLTLLEILGVVAVVITVATIAIMSTKDTVSASQKATIQRELQQLNTALNNFKAAGGVIDPSWDEVQEVIDGLKGGVDLGNSADFTPLVEDPPFAVEVGGEVYNLSYDDDLGFTYQPASGSGESIVGSGGGYTGSGTMPAFDYTNDADTSAAINTFASLPYGSPERAGYLEGFNAALEGGYLSPEEQAALNQVIANDGFVFNVDGKLVDAPFNFTKLEDTQMALQNLTLGTPAAGTLEYEATLIALDKGADANPDLANNIGDALTKEYENAVASGNDQGVDWGGLLGGLGVRSTWIVDGRRFNALQIPPPPPPAMAAIRPYVEVLPLGPTDLPLNLSEVGQEPQGWGLLELKDFTGRDLSSYNFDGARFAWSNLSGATLPDNLDRAFFWLANLSGVDMGNASLVGTNFAGANLAGAVLPSNLSELDLTRTNLSGHNLSTKTLRGTKLAGVDLTGQDFSSVDLTNTSLRAANLSGTTFSASANLASTDLSQANLSGKNLAGWTLPNNLSFANLAGAVLPQDLSNKNFSSAQFGGDQFWGAYNLTGANFAFARNMTNVTLPPLLSGVNFTQVNLSGKNLSGANIVGANFSGANLTWTPLPTNLVNVNLRVTDLSGRNFSGSNLAGTNLQYANVNFASFTGARISGSTMAPDNTTANLDANGTGTWYGKTVINWIVQ
jgi:uncharacterized protein YjbI with pentapeptide repeats/type II secretory pathway pseudopilin PulG